MNIKTNQTTYNDGDFMITEMNSGDVVCILHSFEEVEAFFESLCDWSSYVVYRFSQERWNWYGAKIHVCHIEETVEEE